MDNGYLSPKSNIIFSKIFGDEKNLDILTNFLQSVLDIPEQDLSGLTIVPPNLNQDYSGANVMLRTSNGVIIDVAMQLLKKFNIKEHIACRMTKLLCEQTVFSNSYTLLKPVISVVITDFDFVKNSGLYRHTFRLYDKKNESLFSNLVTISTLELSKLPAKADDSAAWDWAHFFTLSERQDFEMLSAKNKKIGKAVAILAELSQNEEIQLAYQREEEARFNYISEIIKTKKDVARRMKEYGAETDKIIRCTGLTEDEVNSL